MSNEKGYNEYSGKEINEDFPDIDNSIYETEMIIEKIENDIYELWQNVIIPYKRDLCRSQILDDIDEYEYGEFLGFMIDNNKTYKKAVKLLDYLKKL